MNNTVNNISNYLSVANESCDFELVGANIVVVACLNYVRPDCGVEADKCTCIASTDLSTAIHNGVSTVDIWSERKNGWLSQQLR